jgi:hypothetical protein
MVVVFDDPARPWKTLVVDKTQFLGKSTMGPVGSHFQCNIYRSLEDGAGNIRVLQVQIVASKGRKKSIPFNVVEELRQGRVKKP